MRILVLWLLSLVLASCTVQAKGEPMAVKPNAAQDLSRLLDRDNFAKEERGLYTGVHDPALRKKLNAQFGTSVQEFIKATKRPTTEEEFIALLEAELNKFDRLSLDTEDAEHLAANFEKIMDCVGLKSSGGMLNKWMYGFDPK